MISVKGKVPSYIEVRIIVQEIFPSLPVHNWSKKEIKLAVQCISLQKMVEYPQHIQPLFLWLLKPKEESK